MNLKKLIAALSGVVVLGTPALSVAACKGSTPPTVDPTDNTTIMSLKAIGGYGDVPLSLVIAKNPAAASAIEVKAIFDKVVDARVKILGGAAKFAVKDTDYTIDVKAGPPATAVALADGNDLTAAAPATRTFTVTVTALPDNQRVKDATNALQVILPQAKVKIDLATTAPTFGFLTKDYALANGINTTQSDWTSVPGVQVIALFKKAVNDAVNGLANVEGATEEQDYTWTLADGTTPVTAEAGYDFKTAIKNFNVTITAKDGSLLIMNTTAATPIVVPVPILSS